MEIWKDIQDLPGYQISSLGRAKSLKHNNPRILKPEDVFGYFQLGLSNNNKTKRKFIQRLVAENFIPNPNNNPEVNHKDGNKHNNCVENLEWVTSSENILHAYRIGLQKVQHEHLRTAGQLAYKVTRKKVLQFSNQGSFIKEWISIREASRSLGIDHTRIILCCKGRAKTTGGFLWKYS